MSENEVEIEALPRRVGEEAARERVAGRLLSRLKGLLSDRTIVRAELRYKPYYRFDATLRKHYLTDEDLVYDGAIVVDTMTGVSRAMLDDQVELSRRRVSKEALLDPDIDESEALPKAKGRRMQVAARERGEIDMANDPRTVYKPIWLIELASGDVVVVDGTTGEVTSEALFS